jgi:glycosyltransferase involved in cell wall biosynthesis
MTHSGPGGLREIWNDVALGLGARGHAVGRFVFYPDTGGESAREATADGWTHVLPARPGFLGVPGLLWALVRHLRTTRPAAIVTAMPFANVVIPLAVRLAGTGTRVIVSHHSPRDTHNPAIDRLDSLTGRMVCVAAVVSVSDSVAAALDNKPAGYRAKRKTIRNALPDRIEGVIDRLAGEDGPPKVVGRIIALGRLSHQKNYPMLLRAMVHAPAGTLDIVGSGEDEAQLRALAVTCGVADRVRFLGQMKREQALAHAATAAVFVQVSHYEGHSLALIEAARLGLPLVVSDVPVQVEGVTARDGGLCGIIVPLGDEAALGAVLNGLLESADERAAWSARALRLGREASNQAMVDAYESLLVSLAP